MSRHNLLYGTMVEYEDGAHILGLNQQTFAVVVVILILMLVYTLYNVFVFVTFPVRIVCRALCCCIRRSSAMVYDDDDGGLF